MFNVNDTIMYGTQGVCKIVEITQKDFMGAKKDYYVLKPMNDKAATLFAPVSVEKGNKMRKILTPDEVQKLVAFIPEAEANWIPGDNMRKETYKKIIAGGDHVELIRIVKALYLQRTKREALGKHLYLSDERFLKEAERILFDEFQFVLDKTREEVVSMLTFS